MPKKADLARMQWGWRYVKPDFTSSRNYRWPFPGQWAEAQGPFQAHRGACPQGVGDGICIARSFRGAASGGYNSRSILIVGWLPEDLLGEEPDKVRVKRAFVLELIDLVSLLGPGADLRSAVLRSADLRSAVLRSADLRSADLSGADLRSADLSGADLRSADLRSADLSGAVLRSADLRSADLRSAVLRSADLRSAVLSGAYFNRYTCWPIGFSANDARSRGAVLL